jgi:hypothetical protein
MKQLPVFFGALHYEFHMQVRRPAVWITMILIAGLLVGFLSRSNALLNTVYHLDRFPLLTVVASWTAIINRLLPIGVGVLLADRLPRDRRTKVDELFSSMPGALNARLVGKYLGSMLATLLPMFAFYAIGVGVIIYQTRNIMAIPLALETFAVIALPGILFISAFSLACPAIMWVPLYQFCFIGYWFWGNELSPRNGIPTLSDTILTPVGNYMAKGFYGLELADFSATPLQGVESMLVLIAFAIFVLFVLWQFLQWQQARQ